MTTHARRSTLIEGFPVDPPRSERSRIAVEVRRGNADIFVTIEHQIRPDAAAAWHSRRAVSIRLSEIPDLIDVLHDALEVAHFSNDQKEKSA